MSQQKEKISNYWDKRSGSFANIRQDELNSPMAFRWLEEIKRNIPLDKSLKILDIGTGTGFFSILLSELGHEVIGIDFSIEMIREAKILSKKYDQTPVFYVMDAQELEFQDGSFDLVISRNLTWNLTNPEKAYKEWVRVLKKGGILLNFDGEYTKEVYTKNSETLPKKHVHKDIEPSLLDELNSINDTLPLKKVNRPLWDVACLTNICCEDIEVNKEVSNRIYLEVDYLYNPTPMFSIKAIKSEV